MTQTNSPQSTSDKVPEDFGRKVITEIENYSKHDDFRKKVKEIFTECIGTTTFKDKIKEYAGESFNDRLFRNGWAIVIFLASLIIAALVGRLFK
jgi:hypothetical protein